MSGRQVEKTRLPVGSVERWTALAVSLVLTGLWWLDGWWRGVWGIARGDDWSYVRTAFDFAETGTLTLNGWVHMNFIGQAILALPVVRVVGESVLALQVLVGAFSVAFLFLVYLLSRHVLAGPVALIPVFVVGLSPIFGKLTVSFMTDIPSAVLISLSLLLGIRAVQENRIRWSFVVWSLVAAFLAFSIREFGILAALPTLIIVGYRSRHRPRDLFRVALSCVMLALFAAGLFVWRSGLPNDVANNQIGLAEWLGMVAGAFLVLGFLVSPIALPVSVRQWCAEVRQSRGFPLLIGALFATFIAFVAGWEFVGNIIMAYGSTWTSVGDGVPTFPLIVDRVIRFVAVVSVFLVTTLLASWSLGRLRSSRSHVEQFMSSGLKDPAVAILSLFVLILGSAYLLGALIVGSPLFDRYALPLLGPIAALILAAFARRHLISRTRVRMSQVVALALYGAVTFVYVDTAAQVDGARWAIAQEVVSREGISPRYIDGGDPWFRFHQSGAGAPGPLVTGRPWWTTFFPDAVVCRTITLTTQQSAESYYGEPVLSRTHDRLIGEPFTLTVYPGPDACPSQG